MAGKRIRKQRQKLSVQKQLIYPISFKQSVFSQKGKHFFFNLIYKYKFIFYKYFKIKYEREINEVTFIFVQSDYSSKPIQV
jgi:hypothetical protein